ncbi:hypothetical protein DFO66_103363 [Brevibacterium sanguinis]|uniref:Uncharacterized protein n=2 Tax=Brevibacterium TaxID=1696 RepID=A0A366ILH1_9MICO|nr:hypothetical protein [Brevibacterium sanguinis]RBP66416.1 hypothetical protein DFO66_103363 [Brevibacterium sanguinis]RBP73068.1 hypothetical protein DFO65_103363 [Brevibacterium celere]
MSALQEVADFAESQRERLCHAITATIDHLHSDEGCNRPAEECVAWEMEHALRMVDYYAVTLGTPWHVAVKFMADSYERALAKLEGEI